MSTRNRRKRNQNPIRSFRVLMEVPRAAWSALRYHAVTEPAIRNLHVASGTGAFRLSILDAVSDAVWWASYSRPAHDPWWRR